MVDEFLTDEQQADVVRKWIRDNGAYMLGGLVLGLGGLLGWNQWQDYNTVQSAEASELYEEILVSIQNDRGPRADALMLDLENDFGRSPYLDQARLNVAKYHLDRSEFESAASFLGQVVSNSRSDEMKHIARLRLVQIRIQQQQLDQALDILASEKPESAFAARYHDLRGDVFYALGRPDEARSEYQAALSDPQQPPVVDRMYVQAKLDDLGAQAPGIGLDDALGDTDSPPAGEAASTEPVSQD
jgi:predicted negative regulator of RcsB-dependent stress response